MTSRSFDARRVHLAGRPRRSAPSAAPAFTLIELLVVVAIIGLLLSILIPSLAAAREQARTVKCQSNNRQLLIGWLTYATEHNATLPGGTYDFIDNTTGNVPNGQPPIPVDYNKYTSFSWLGNVGENGQQTDEVPRRGTIYKYVGEMDEVYKCPTDLSDVADDLNPPLSNTTKYSYTAPPMLSGASIDLLRGTYFADNFPANHAYWKWEEYAKRSLPWVLIEEDEEKHLANVKDSAWSNEDRVSDRHSGGRGMIGFIDGHASATKLQRTPRVLDGYRVHYELSREARNSVANPPKVGRIVWARPWFDSRGDTYANRIRWGYLKRPYVWVEPL